MSESAIAGEIKSELESLGLGSRQGHRPSAQKDFGVYTGDLRSVVRKFKNRLKTENAEFVLQVANQLIDQNITESRQVAYELISSHKYARQSLTVEMIESLGRRLDNWCCVDNFCSNVAGPAWREGRVDDSKIDLWSRSDDLWWRRVAVVCTVALNTKSHGGKGDPVRTFKVCLAVLEDSEIMVQKAISWALRQVVSWDSQAVEQFMKQHHVKISARVRREVTTKLETGWKN
jgi:3-methyladenine DNA glycosylase AlkD